MSKSSQHLDLSTLIPGFDFFKQMAGKMPGMGAAGSASSNPFMPKSGSWIAPTLSVEELEKRITELQTVKLWLENNARLIEATIQAMQVQKMTLSTLKGMNVKLGDIASSFGNWPTAAKTNANTRSSSSKTRSSRSKTHFDLGQSAGSATAEPADTPARNQGKAAQKDGGDGADAAAAGNAAMTQALQMWQGLTQQFGQIAGQVMQESQAAAQKLAAQQPSKKAAPKTATKTVVKKHSRTAAAKPSAAKKSSPATKHTRPSSPRR